MAGRGADLFVSVYALKRECRVVQIEAELDLYSSISRALEAWAKWRMEGHGADIGFPGESAFRRMMVVEGEANLPCIPINDDLAIAIDRAVSNLKARSFDTDGDYRWVAIVESYLCYMPDSRIAKTHRISKSAARNARQAGENWIEGHVLTERG
jgi:hypothetical protein